MLFLSPTLLWFLAAAAVPVLIHLLNRRRHKTIPWAAMQFLLKATRESRGRKKLRHILILTARSLGVAALAAAAARPIASGLLGWGGGAADTIIVLLDRSASMELREGDGLASRRQLALGKIRDTLRDLGSPRVVLIDSATGNPQEIPSPSELPELSSTAATDAAADLPGMLVRAAEVLAANPGRAEIWLASDLQTSNWKPDDDRWLAARAALAGLPEKPALRILSFTGKAAPNQSVRILSSRREDSDLVLDVEISRSSDARTQAAVPLTVSRPGGAAATENLVLPGPSLRFQKRLPLPENEDAGFGWLSIPGDGNPRDNAAFFAYGPARPARTLVVSAAGETGAYLALAAAPPTAGGTTADSAEVLPPADFPARDLAETAAILWAAPLPSGPAAAKLRAFLETGGQAAFFPAAGKPSENSFDNVSWAPPEESPAGKFFLLKDWNHADGLLRDGLDGTPVAARRLRAIRRQTPLGDTLPLARWEDGEPAVTRKIIGRGTAWFISTPPDYTWSNLGDADVLLPAVQRIVRESAARFQENHMAQLGDASAAPADLHERADNYRGAENPAGISDAGVFRISGRHVAVNRPAAEDEPETLPRELLGELFTGLDFTLLDEAGRAGNTDSSSEISRTFLLAALLFLLAEAILCLPQKPAAVAHSGSGKYPAPVSS